MESHNIYEVIWQENGRKKKSYFAEVAGRYFAELKVKDALRITHDNIHLIAEKNLSSCTPMNMSIRDYFDDVICIRKVCE